MPTSDSHEAKQAQAVYDLQNRFQYHKPDGPRVDAHQDVRQTCQHAAFVFFSLLPDGREKALAMTKIEEAMFWANAAIARAPKD